MEIDLHKTVSDLRNEMKQLEIAIERLNHMFHVKHDHLARLHVAVAMAHDPAAAGDLSMTENGFPIFV